jgi:putative membrane protein
MTLRLILAWLHLLALAVGLAGGVGAGSRARRLPAHPEDPRAIRRALVGDAWWAIAAVAWLATGLWRLFAGTEKPPSYYVASYAFAIKMGLFMVVLALEIWPSTTLMRWRRKKSEPNARDVGRIEIISYVQCALVAAMALAAVAMARGYGSPTGVPAAPADFRRRRRQHSRFRVGRCGRQHRGRSADPASERHRGRDAGRHRSPRARDRDAARRRRPRDAATATSTSVAAAARASTRRSTSWRRAAPRSDPPRRAAC